MGYIDIDEIKMWEPIFLQKAEKKGYVCPVCGSGSGSHGTGITFNSKTHEYHCWACGYNGDLIDLFAYCYGIESNRKAVLEIQDFYKMHQNGEMDRIPQVKIFEPSAQNKGNYFSYYQQCMRANNGQYLAARGILKPLQDRFCIGFDHDWQNPVAVEKMKEMGRNPKAVPTSPRVIIPTNPSSYFARDVRTEIPEKQKPYEKQNVGPVGLYGLQHADTERPVFIVEGQIDALSVYQVGGQAIATCGIGNYDHVLPIINDFPYLFLMYDMDDRGQAAQGNLRAELIQNDIDFECVSYDFHDPNDYLQNDIHGFLNLILDRLK